MSTNRKGNTNAKGYKNSANKNGGKGKTYCGNDRNNPSNKTPKQSNSKQGIDENAETRVDNTYNRGMEKMKKQAVSNDPAWYASDPNLAKDAASIPFSWASGTESDITGGSSVVMATSRSRLKFTAPGVLVQYLTSSLGETESPASPINIASTAVYSYVRHANSGSSNYDSPDLMLYILAMGDILAMTNFCIRAYGVASLYSSRNRYLPDGLLRAMCIDPVDMRQNLAQYRYGLNLLMNKASSLAVPSI